MPVHGATLVHGALRRCVVRHTGARCMVLRWSMVRNAQAWCAMHTGAWQATPVRGVQRQCMAWVWQVQQLRGIGVVRSLSKSGVLLVAAMWQDHTGLYLSLHTLTIRK